MPENSRPGMAFDGATMNDVSHNGGVKVRPMRTCFLCGEEGVTLYLDQRDRMFAAPGTWSLLRCLGCGFVWLNPRPIPSDIRLLYSQYHTHSAVPDALNGTKRLSSKAKKAILGVGFGYDQPWMSRAWLAIGFLLSHVDPLRDLVGATIRWLPQSFRGRLLDVGCGAGDFLAQMRDLGWEVRGVEPDPAAVRVARSHFGLDVTCQTLEEARFPAERFDVITLGHVIEHLPDPIGTLRECRRVLTPTGRLVIVTPNVDSLGHYFFGAFWRGLEVPRHLQLYSPSTLQRSAERAGLRVSVLRTTANSARWMLAASRELRRLKRLPGGSPGPVARNTCLGGLAFWALERALATLRPVGEEVVMFATPEATS